MICHNEDARRQGYQKPLAPHDYHILVKRNDATNCATSQAVSVLMLWFEETLNTHSWFPAFISSLASKFMSLKTAPLLQSIWVESFPFLNKNMFVLSVIPHSGELPCSLFETSLEKSYRTFLIFFNQKYI